MAKLLLGGKIIKCGVCSQRVAPIAATVYTVQGDNGILKSCHLSPQLYDVLDCPRCGCQVMLALRYPRVTESDNVIGDEDTNIKRFPRASNALGFKRSGWSS